MAIVFNREPRFPPLISQRQIDLEEDWWKDRVSIIDCYIHQPWTLNYDSFQTTLDGFWWSHHQLQLGPLVIEWTIRRKAMNQ